MTAGGVIMMVFAWGLILTLAGFSFRLFFKNGKR